MIIFYTEDAILNQVESTYPTQEFTLFGMRNNNPLTRVAPNREWFPDDATFQNDTESNFDFYYWQQLMNDEGTFMDLMQVLAMEYLHGGEIVIMVQTMNTPYRMSVTESLIMFLQAIYGLDCRIAMSIEDLALPEMFNPTPFSKDGIARISADMEKYVAMGGIIS